MYRQGRKVSYIPLRGTCFYLAELLFCIFPYITVNQYELNIIESYYLKLYHKRGHNNKITLTSFLESFNINYWNIIRCFFQKSIFINFR